MIEILDSNPWSADLDQLSAEIARHERALRHLQAVYAANRDKAEIWQRESDQEEESDALCDSDDD